MQLLQPGTPEWSVTWTQLEKHPLNDGLSDPKEALNVGETWQYMGPEGAYQTFRHRCHPTTGRREYVRIQSPVQTPCYGVFDPAIKPQPVPSGIPN